MKLKTIHYRDLLIRFETHIISSKSIKSGNHYKGQAEDFLRYLEERELFNLKEVDTPIMKAYFHYLIERPLKRGKGKPSPRTVNDNLSTLRMFSLRMQKENIIQKGLPVPKNIQTETTHETDFSLVRQILTTDEVREVFLCCENETEKALIALCYGSGMRRSELTELNEKQIDFQKGLVSVLASKNNKTRQVPISDFFLGILKEYSRYRLSVLSKANSKESSFFIDENAKPLSGDNLNELLKSIVKRTENESIIEKKITLHCLRHSIATHLMDAGESFEYVKTFLGHSIADTSMIYAKRRKIKSVYQI